VSSALDGHGHFEGNAFDEDRGLDVGHGFTPFETLE
jgi:hypothetical protein